MTARQRGPDTEQLEPLRRGEPQRVAVNARGMVASAHSLATAAGVEMLEAGGNAFDAAVAAAFALGVCEPQASGLGGQTMLLVRDAASRRTIAIDGSSRAPNRARAEAMKPRERREGYRATTVPSTPAVLDYVRERYGTKPLADVLAPAIRIAQEGFTVSALQHALMRRERLKLKRGTAGLFFLKGGRRAYPEGAVLQQPVLGATLRRLARKGIEDFYRGGIARKIHADMAHHGGWIQRDDLAQIPLPIERRPVTARWNGSRVFTMPLPGAGRTLVEMLNVLAEFPPERRDPDTPRGALLLAEVIRQANRDRRDRPFDPNFYAQVLDQKMVSHEYAREVARRLRKTIRTTGETTHLSVMDAAGNAVALTQSIERVFGSAAASHELGFLYNDYMAAFEYEDLAHPYYMRPNAVPWASVAPTIVMRGGRPWLTIGSPGSERIAPSIVQVLLRLTSGESPLEAVAAPRLYCSLEGKVSLEAARMRDDVPRLLETKGFEIDVREPWSFYLGCVQLVMKSGRELVGVADPRRDGSAAGPKR